MIDSESSDFLPENPQDRKNAMSERGKDRFDDLDPTFLLDNIGKVPPGHFYSPIPSIEEIKRNEKKIFGDVKRTLPGIDFFEKNQLELLEIFSEHYYEEMPFQPSKIAGLRFYFENPMFSYADAISLYCMIRHLRPKRIIEIGSGFSSAVALDTNDIFFNGSIETIFIEPYNERLLSLLMEQDKGQSSIIKERVQDVDIELFSQLGANDILFIDSTHVSKIGSDVNRIFFDILPVLSKGVNIHFHDIFLPSEYPPQWIYEGRAWNEAYILRAFLQFNKSFQVTLMNNFMGRFHEPFLSVKMPLFMKNIGGSFWIKKVS